MELYQRQVKQTLNRHLNFLHNSLHRSASSLENKPGQVAIETIFDGQVSRTCETTKQTIVYSRCTGYCLSLPVTDGKPQYKIFVRFQKQNFRNALPKAREFSQSRLKLFKINIKPSGDATINCTCSNYTCSKY